jgi:hypothetical protein
MNFPNDLFLDGGYRAAADGRRIALVDPATEEPFVEVAAATVSDVDGAIRSAHAAWEGGWRDLAPGKRAGQALRAALPPIASWSLLLPIRLLSGDSQLLVTRVPPVCNWLTRRAAWRLWPRC